MSAYLAIAALIATATASRAPVDSARWIVSGKLYGRPAKDGGVTGEPATDVSGMACAPAATGARICLLVDDESQGAQLVILKGRELVAGDVIRLIDIAFEGKPLELDAEAVAWADGAFYVIGSHGRPRHGQGEKERRNLAKAEATRSLFEIRLPPGAVDLETGRLTGRAAIASSRGLASAILAEPALAPAFDRSLEEGGVTIEGLAVLDGTAFVGFRGPVLDEDAAVLAVPLSSLLERASAKQASLIRLRLGRDTFGRPRGIRDLIAIDGEFVGISGPMLDPVEKNYVIRAGDYALFRWKPGGTPVVRPLGAFPPGTKPEGLLALSYADGRLSGLMLFDGSPDGVPVPVEQDLSAAVPQTGTSSAAVRDADSRPVL